MIHREGWPTIIITLIVCAILTFICHYFLGDYLWVMILNYALCAFLLITVLQFFRNPKRIVVPDDTTVIAPADGKVVVIEEVSDAEYFHDRRLQVSIFMSPINVHVNRFPISGIVKYVKYHAGLYLVAWHPKSSTDNERTTVVVEHPNGKSVLFRQIAGALARRIVYYCKEGDKAVQGQEFGFIKFGSRVDILLPVGTKIDVQLNQVVSGGRTVIARF
jgi:phosphatidylserine decarboxylase